MWLYDVKKMLKGVMVCICIFVGNKKINKDMSRNVLLIEKYRIYIKKMERELEETKDSKRIIHLASKISVYKMVIIDLQE
jgi:hypothetical protein